MELSQGHGQVGGPSPGHRHKPSPSPLVHSAPLQAASLANRLPQWRTPYKGLYTSMSLGTRGSVTLLLQRFLQNLLPAMLHVYACFFTYIVVRIIYATAAYEMVQNSIGTRNWAYTSQTIWSEESKIQRCLMEEVWKSGILCERKQSLTRKRHKLVTGDAAKEGILVQEKRTWLPRWRHKRIPSPPASLFALRLNECPPLLHSGYLKKNRQFLFKQTMVLSSRITNKRSFQNPSRPHGRFRVLAAVGASTAETQGA